MKKQLKLLTGAALVLALSACSSLDTTGLENLNQSGEVNIGNDSNMGYVVVDGVVYSVGADGTLTAVDVSTLPDFDNDGTPDILDTDMDGDGILNVNDADMDGDGIINELDTDIDGDGIANIDDADIDGDGIANNSDSDIDGDGVDNINDADIDGDGIDNSVDNDIDGDGIDNSVDTDVDGDGIDNSVDTDIDGDGIDNAIDEDIDGDGVINENDTDQDGDQIIDTQDPDTNGETSDPNGTDDANGNISVTASNDEVIDISILAGQTSATEPSSIDIVDLRQEIKDNNMQLSTVQITDFKISAPTAGNFAAAMGSVPASIVVKRGGVVLFQSAPGVVVNDLITGLSALDGTLQLSINGVQGIENEVKDQTNFNQVDIDVDLTLGSPASANYDVQLIFEVVTNGKAEI